MSIFRNLALLLLAIITSLILIPITLIRNFIYKIWQFEELSSYIFSIAHGIDVMGASVLFGTTYKTVSGVVGKKAEGERSVGHSKSYIYPFEKMINWLFNDPTHCVDAYRKEYLK